MQINKRQKVVDQCSKNYSFFLQTKKSKYNLQMCPFLVETEGTVKYKFKYCIEKHPYSDKSKNIFNAAKNE